MNILPDPNNKMNSAGQLDPAGTAGPGFASVTLTSVEPIMRTRTNSNRLLTRSEVGQKWQITIGYNKMSRQEFEVLNAFLLAKNGGLTPFFVELPQYLVPQDSAMTTDPTTSAAVSAGSTSIPFTSTAGVPTRGDLFTVNDSSDSAHTKAYKVVSVDAGVITCSPGVVRDISSGATLVFSSPKLRVVLAGDSVTESLDVNNLYSFGLKLEEAQV